MADPNPVDPALLQIPGLSSYLAMKHYMANQEQQDQVRGLQREFIQRRQALGPNASPEDLTNLGAQYASPHELMQYGQASVDRKAALQQKADAVDKLFEFKIKNMDANLEATMRRITNEEHRTELKNAVDEQKNELTKMRNEIMLQLGVSKQNQPNKPPSGYRATQEGNLEPIPGGPADLKVQGQFNQDTSALNEGVANMDRLAQEATALKDHPGLGRITGIPGALPNVPGLAGANAEARLATLKSQTGLNVLQMLRNNSKTGGALGQVSDFENKMLQANLASLDRAQSKEEYQKALQRIIDYTEGAKDRLRAAYNLKHKGGSPAAPSADIPEGVDPRVWGAMTPQEKALFSQ